MAAKSASLLSIIVRYDPLLQRYARRILHDEKLADAIVLDLLQDIYEFNKFRLPPKKLRRLFKKYTTYKCRCWLQRLSHPGSYGNGAIPSFCNNTEIHLLKTAFIKKPKNPT